MADKSIDVVQRSAEIAESGLLLDELAKENKIGPIYERKELVEYCFKKLLSNNNLMIVGKPGVGKNAIVESIAIRIASITDENFPIKHVLQTNPSKLVEGCYYVGNLENKLLTLTKNCSDSKTVLFLDNAHLGIGLWSGSEASKNDLINILNNSLLPDTRLICSVTPEGLKMLEGTHPEFTSGFVKVEVPPTTPEETYRILKNLKEEFQKGKGIANIQNTMLSELVKLASFFYRSREFPGKAFEILLQVLDDNEGKTKITTKELYKYLMKETGLPDFFIIKNKPVRVEEIKSYFNEFIFGQDEAIDEVIPAILKFKSRLTEPNKPASSMLFIGPSGVGKTELAKVLAGYLFGSEEKLFIYPMSQYKDADGFRKLLGSPTSQTSELLYGTGKLKKDVKSSPFSVILLDEIDQANRDVINGLYQILDEGRSVENNGDITSFISSIIIMSTNVGMEEFFSEGLGFTHQNGLRKENLTSKIVSRLEAIFGEAFLNRIEKIIIFNPIDKDIVKKIILKIANNYSNSLLGLTERKIKIKIEEDALGFLAEVGFNKKYGARNIRRTFNDYCLNKISSYLAENPSTYNKTFVFKLIKGVPDFTVE